MLSGENDANRDFADYCGPRKNALPSNFYDLASRIIGILRKR
jgi:hypothetical protein